MVYRKLKRTWSHGYANHIPRFKEVFPELLKINSEELCDRFIDLNMEFYCEEEKPVNVLVRLTLLFAIIMFLLMIISLPLVFIITGKWGYPLGEKNYIYNWFKSLKLL